MNEPSLQRDPVEVLAEEFLQRRRRGEAVSIQQYAEQHPEWADRIREVFSTALWLEEFREQGGKIDRPGPPSPEAALPVEGEPAGKTLPFCRLGDFRIIREIGRGGMGVVYEAEQESLGRRVAVKVLPRIHLSSPSAVRRFRREAKAAARLHHTNIIPVFGVGQQDGIHYYVMQYIRGLSLDEVLEELRGHLVVGDSSASTVSAMQGAGQAGSKRAEAIPEGPLGPISEPVPPELSTPEIPLAARTDREEGTRLVQLLLTGGFAGSAGGGFGIPRVTESSTESSAVLPAVGGAGSEGAKSSAPPGPSSSGSSTVGVSGGQEKAEGSAGHGGVSGSSGPERLPGPVAESAKPTSGMDSGRESSPSKLAQPEGLLSGPIQLGPGYWRSVAGVGLQVANALHYAHQQGALHRDIKPGNLILDAEGRVWVADFGLAKLLDQEEMTRSGDVVGTLRYMAPEQWEAQADARTDVYGLGLTLYEMATLQPAFDETDRASLIRQVMHEEPTPPRKLQPTLPRDLETIILKAVARQPADRYQTAAELAEDLRRFLEDRPVRARRVSVLERLWRWCRRNKLVAALSTAVLGLLVVVAVVASIGYMRTSAALRRESVQRAQAEAARKLADAERSRAEQEREKAQTEYLRAEANLRLAIQAFEDIFHRLVREPVFQPHPPAQQETEGEETSPTEETWELYGWTSTFTEKDAAVVQTMLAFYERFAQQNADNRTLQQETAQAYRRMGEIYLRLGNYEEAEKALQKARSIYGRIASEEKQAGLAIVDRAIVENRLGDVYWFTGRWSQALPYYQTARQMLAEAPEAMAQSAACRLELARTYSALGRCMSWRWMVRRSGRKPPPAESAPSALEQEELSDPVACYQQAIRLLEELVAQSPQHPEYRLALARTYREWAMFAGRRLPPEQIASARQKSLELVEKLAADFPASPDYRFELAETYAAMARAGGRGLGSPEDRPRLQEALRIETELVQKYPHVPDYQAGLARLHTELARWSASAGQWDQAEEHLRQAIALQQALADRFPDLLPYQMELGRQWIFLSAALQAQGKKEENRKFLEEAIQRAEKMLQRPDRTMLARGFLSWAYAAHAEVLQQLGQTDQAQQARRKAEQFRPKDAPGPRPPWIPGSLWNRLRPKPPPEPTPLPKPSGPSGFRSKQEGPAEAPGGSNSPGPSGPKSKQQAPAGPPPPGAPPGTPPENPQEQGGQKEFPPLAQRPLPR